MAGTKTKAGDGDVADNGTADQTGQAAGSDAVVLGTGAGPITPGGPGAGAAQTAEKVDGVVTAPLTEGAAADLGLRGPLAGNAPLTADERAELAQLQTELSPERALLTMLRREKAGLVIDAKDVPGQRIAEAATYIKRDGVEYAPDGDNRLVPLDYKSFVELRQIGAIVDRPWGDLPMANDLAASET